MKAKSGWLLLFVSAFSLAAEPPDIDLIDINGINHGSLINSDHSANVLFFITDDCPISNQYAPEIARICEQYSAQAVSCFLVYVDPDLTAERIAKHRED